jgi:hypothetical protein
VIASAAIEKEAAEKIMTGQAKQKRPNNLQNTPATTLVSPHFHVEFTSFFQNAGNPS